MGLFSHEKKTHFNSASNLSNHIWHFEGEKTYEDCDSGTGFFGGTFKTRDRFSHYLAAGFVKSESRLKERERDPIENRSLVIRWLVLFGLLWILFYFIKL